jgi:hypothetical protein
MKWLCKRYAVALKITVDSLFVEEKGEMAQTRLRCQHYFLLSVF